MKKNIAVLNFWHTNNYGALLTCYSLQQTLVSLGYKPYIICYKPTKYGLSEQFAKCNLNITKELFSFSDLVALNNIIDTFIVGSDQVWRYKYSWYHKTIYHLDFVSPTAKKISCAASFGQDYFEGPSEDITRIKYYLKKFDHISVREDSGVNICKNIFDINADHILDPVFYLEPEDYDLLIKKSNIEEKNFIATYILDTTEEINFFVESIKREFSVEKCIILPNAQKDISTKYSVEDWLYIVKNCNFLVTDSFHGVCFALIFNKPFV